MRNEKFSDDSSFAPSFAKQIRDVFLIGLTIGLFKLSFINGPFPYLSWMVLVPLGIAVHSSSTRYCFSITMICVMFSWLLAIWWIIPGITEITSTNRLAAVLFLLCFCFFCALPYAFSALLYTKLGWSRTISGAFKGAVVWTTVCLLFPQILPGNIVHSQYLYPKVIQVCELGGIPLLFFMMHITNFLLVTAFINLSSKPTVSITALILAVIIPLSAYVYGHFTIEELNKSNAAKPAMLTIGLIQPNIPTKARSRQDWKKWCHYVSNLTLSAGKHKPDLLIWPEIPMPISFVQEENDREMISQILEEVRAPLLIAGYQENDHASESNIAISYSYNTAEFIKSPKVVEVYQKQVLVPFGEYIPFENKLPWLRKLFPATPKYQAGKSIILFKMDNGAKLLPLICYEAIFPSLVNSGVQDGGNIIVNQVNDAWFGLSDGPEVHLALAIFRAVEFRRPMVRVSNSGRSVIVDETGSITSSIDRLFEPGYLIDEIKLDSKKVTIYSRFFKCIPLVLLLASIIVICLDFYRPFEYKSTIANRKIL